MGLKVTKNTIGKGLNKVKLETQNKGELAIKRAMEVARSEIVPETPVVTSRLKNSLQGFSSTTFKGKLLGGSDAISEIKYKGKRIIGFIGTNVPYALSVELKRKFFSRGFAKARKNMELTIKNTLRIK